MVTRLIIVNSAVWVLVGVIRILLSSGGGTSMVYLDIIDFISMPSSFGTLLQHPWSPITSIFLHEDFKHIFWNMISFYWFGRIVGDLLGNHRILPLYLLGGLVGDFVFFVVWHIGPYGGSGVSYALGASAAVMAMLACAATIAPDYEFNLLFVGNVKLKYIALLLLFMDVLGIADNFNAGGHFAHLGGAAFGWIYATNLRQGKDFGAPIVWVIDYMSGWWRRLFSGKPPMRKVYQEDRRRAPAQEQRPKPKQEPRREAQGEGTQDKLDSILDKIKQSGYESLTQEEKDFLFRASKK